MSFKYMLNKMGLETESCGVLLCEMYDPFVLPYEDEPPFLKKLQNESARLGENAKRSKVKKNSWNDIIESSCNVQKQADLIVIFNERGSYVVVKYSQIISICITEIITASITEIPILLFPIPRIILND